MFCAVVFAACLITGSFAIYSLHQAYLLFTHATKPEYIPLMAEKMYTKAVIGFCIACLVSIGIALPIGIYLFRQVSKPYIYIFENLTDIAQKRLMLEKECKLSDGVITSIRRFLELWRFDYEKLHDYEKEKEWKNGARMLLHELKNPLTPLKLSIQKMLMQDSNQFKDDLNTIVNATADIENILNCFKELVNIEFGPKESFDAIAYFNELNSDSNTEKNRIRKINLPEGSIFPVISERTLLKIVYMNLVRNGLEENPSEFSIDATINEQSMILDFITPGKRIENPSRIFRLGNSTKGRGRGYGLFICRKISEYLDLDIKCVNRPDSVVFSICLNRTDKLLKTETESCYTVNRGVI